MQIDHDTKRQLIEFARSQMDKRGEIDALIFTAENITAGLKKASEALDKAVKDVDQALRSVAEDKEDD